MLRFSSVAEMDAAFRTYIEQVRVESLGALVSAAHASIDSKYRNLPYPLEINGEAVSKVPPIEIAEAVRASVGADSGMVYVDSEQADAYWSARRYAALAPNGNPFAAVLQELQTGRIIEVTGLKTHP
jgi:hypothetical protein